MNANRERSNQTLDQRIGRALKIKTLILYFFATISVFGETSQSQIVLGSNDSALAEKAIEQCKNLKSEQEKDRCVSRRIKALKGEDICAQKEEEAKKALGKARAACGEAGVEANKCLERAKECAEYVEEEQPLGSMLSDAASQFFPQFASAATALGSMSATPREIYRGQCMNRSDFKSERQELQQSMKELGDEIKDLQRETAEAKKEAEDEKKEVSDELTQITVEQTERETKRKEDIRRSEQELLTAKVRTRAEIQNARSEIIPLQAEHATLLIKRGLALKELEPALVKTECAARVNELIKKKYPSVNLIGGAFLMSFAQQKRAEAKNQWELCLEKARQMREQQRIEYSGKIEQVESQIANLKEKINSLEEGLKVAGDDAVTAKKESEQAAFALKEADKQKAVALANKALAAENRMKQTVAEKTEALNKAKSSIAKASADLVSLGARPAGEQTPAKAYAAMQDYLAVRSVAKEACGSSFNERALPDFGTSKETKGTDD